jgi:glycosyltransferase involved in cell wall biosynthesis
VRDLARGLDDLGHEVGVVCDSLTGDGLAEQRLLDLERHCKLGVTRIKMSRMPGPGDLSTANKVVSAAKALQPDILHGHGAKGGAYARLAASRLGAQSVYTPHGGVLHYSWASAQGFAFLTAEKLLLRKTSGLVFVCDYERKAFDGKVGLGQVANVVAHNGLWDEEFEPVALEPDCTDILFVGELRALKGVDELLDALAILNRDMPVRATITGAGPDAALFKARAENLGLSPVVTFTGALPAREAFAKGWLMVIPSRAESFPYIVLETVAAAKPLLATRVGGIAEVLPEHRLLPPNDAAGLAERIKLALSDRDGEQKTANELAARFRQQLSASAMSRRISDFYTALAH